MVKYLGGDQVSRKLGTIFAPDALPLRLDALASHDTLESSRFPTFYWLHRGSGDEHITDLAGRPTHAVKKPSVEHDAGADASADGKKDKVPYSFCGADLTLCNRGRIHIVLYCRRHAETGFQQRAQRNVSPAHEIGRGQHDTLVHIRYPGRPGRKPAQRASR